MKYGRLPRTFDPRIPHFSALVAGQKLPALPPAVNYTRGMPANLGVMLNDTLGDCTAAACGHADQVWSFNACGKMLTPADNAVLALYEATGGYIPGQPNTDQGANMQTVLAYWLTSGLDANKLAAYVEIDPRNLSDVHYAVWQCGLAYTGLNVPAFMQGLETPGSIWDVNPRADNSIVGGHCVDIVGYGTDGLLEVESWGSTYYMTPAFWAAFVDEVYGLANALWMASSGLSILGLTLAELTGFMQSITHAPVPPAASPARHHRRRMRWRRNS